jgi:hypothetical protein
MYPKVNELNGFGRHQKAGILMLVQGNSPKAVIRVVRVRETAKNFDAIFL